MQKLMVTLLLVIVLVTSLGFTLAAQDEEIICPNCGSNEWEMSVVNYNPLVIRCVCAICGYELYISYSTDDSISWEIGQL